MFFRGQVCLETTGAAAASTLYSPRQYLGRSQSDSHDPYLNRLARSVGSQNTFDRPKNETHSTIAQNPTELATVCCDAVTLLMLLLLLLLRNNAALLLLLQPLHCCATAHAPATAAALLLLLPLLHSC